MRLGLSMERVRQTVGYWINYLDTLKVDYFITDISPEKSRCLANYHFENSQSHCLSRNIVLGQYVDLIQKGADSLLVPSRAKQEEFLVCDSIRFVPAELSLKFGDQVKIFNPVIGDDQETRYQLLYKLAKQFGVDDQTAIIGAESWRGEYSRVNHFAKDNRTKSETVMLIGRVDHFMDYTNENSSLMHLLTDVLNVDIITPSMVKIQKRYLIKDNFRQLGGERFTYWNRSYILNAVYNCKDDIDGVLLIHDAHCMISMEEIQYLVHYINKAGLPNYVLSINHNSLISAETSLEAFVDMIRFKKGKDCFV